MKTFLIATAFAAAISAHADAKAPLPGFTYMTPTGENVKWASLPIAICPAANLPAKLKKELKEAAAVWNKTLDTEVFKTDCAIKSRLYAETDREEHGVYWLTKGFDAHTEKTSLARTLVQFEDNGNMLDADILINGEYYDWNTLAVDARTVLIHELGHVLGLKHFPLSTNSAMNFYPYVGGYVHRNLGLYEKAVFETLYKKQSPKVADYVELYFADNLDGAIAAAEKSKVKAFDEVFALAVLQSQKKDSIRARDSFAKAVDMQPDDAFVRSKYADALWAAGDIAGAEREFLRTISQDPKNFEARTSLGTIYLQSGRAKEGTEMLKQSLKIQPANWVACELLNKQSKSKVYADCAKKFGPK